MKEEYRVSRQERGLGKIGIERAQTAQTEINPDVIAIIGAIERLETR